MANYISREAAIEAVKHAWAKGLEPSQYIEILPAADVAEVVRCKDCKHRTEAGNCGHPRHHGILPSAYPYDFCSYGDYQTNTGGATE